MCVWCIAYKRLVSYNLCHHFVTLVADKRFFLLRVDITIKLRRSEINVMKTMAKKEKYTQIKNRMNNQPKLDPIVHSNNKHLFKRPLIASGKNFHQILSIYRYVRTYVYVHELIAFSEITIFSFNFFLFDF